MRVLTGAVVLLSIAVPAMAQKTVVCSSSGNAKRVCPADTRNGVVLVRERSDGVCEQGSTWGYNPRGIYVSGGCSAEFQVGGRGNNDGNANGYGNGNGNNDNQNRNQNGYGNNGNNSNGYGNNNNNGNGNSDRQRNGNGQNDDDSYRNGQRGGGSIPAGTRMDVKLEQTVSPSNAQRGDVIPGRLVNDVVVNGSTVAAAGAQVQMRVTAAQAGNPGTLSLQLDSMSVNGRDYKLSSNSIHSVRDSQTSQNGNNDSGGGNVLGSVLGAISNARQTGELPSGSVYTFRLTTSARTGGTSNRNNQ